jgi:hypothetical protein
LISHVKGTTRVENVQEPDAGNSIWIKYGRIIAEWRKLHNALNYFNSLNIRMITVGRIRWARHTAYVRKEGIPGFGRL